MIFFNPPYSKIKGIIFSYIKDYFFRYKSLPSKDNLILDIIDSNKLNEREEKELQDYQLRLIKETVTLQWLLDKTEIWCKDRSLHNAILKSIQIVEGSDKGISKTAIPSILQEALSVCFDHSIGHAYNDDYILRLDNRLKKDKKIPFDIDNFNEITKGGLSSKTLSVVVAGTGVGKSLFMCHCATSALKKGNNVLYITCEMSEEAILQKEIRFNLCY